MLPDIKGDLTCDRCKVELDGKAVTKKYIKVMIEGEKKAYQGVNARLCEKCVAEDQAFGWQEYHRK
jgi:hypothetical protein